MSSCTKVPLIGETLHPWYSEVAANGRNALIGVTIRFPATATFAACLAIATITTLIAVALPAVPAYLRLPLTLFSALFVPGYLLVSAVFPQQRHLDNLLRLCLSLACSFAIIIGFSLLIAISPLDRSADTELLAINGGIAALTVAAVVRHRRLPPAHQPTYRVALTARVAKPDRFTILALVLVVMLAAAGGVGVVAANGNQATALAFVTVQGDQQAGQPITVVVDVVSHEAASTTFQLLVTWQQQALAQASFALTPGQSARETLKITSPPGTGETPLSVMLLKQGSTTPYRQLTVWLRTIPYRPA